MVKYENGQLVVSFNTHAPEELHHALMQSCVANLKNQSISDLQVQDYVKENNYWTLELLENLIPSVDELQKINQESHGK